MSNRPAEDWEPAGLEALRKPFPKAVIGKLPKQGTMLDYVGHAAVTDRLLTVDPHWSWEPVAWDEQGLPLYDRAGGLWIRLTVCGMTRLGYGDGPDPKQRIGDAIRNAAMRFGVALDLWTKGELESQDPNGGGGDAVRNYDERVEREIARDLQSSPRKAERQGRAPKGSTPNVEDDPFAAPEWATPFRTRLAKAMTPEALEDRWQELQAAVRNAEVSPEWGQTLKGEIAARKAHLESDDAKPEAAA